MDSGHYVAIARNEIDGNWSDTVFVILIVLLKKNFCIFFGGFFLPVY